MEEYPESTRFSEDSKIETDPNQGIAVKTDESDIFVATSNSKIKLVKRGFFSYLFREVYYFFTPNKTRNISVRTGSSTLGIRGTKFLIDSESGDVNKDKISLIEDQLNFHGDRFSHTGFRCYWRNL